MYIFFEIESYFNFKNFFLIWIAKNANCLKNISQIVLDFL